MKQIFKKTNRFLAAFLAVAMVLTMLPVSQATAWALDAENNIVDQTDADGTGTEAETSIDIRQYRQIRQNRQKRKLRLNPLRLRSKMSAVQAQRMKRSVMVIRTTWIR